MLIKLSQVNINHEIFYDTQKQNNLVSGGIPAASISISPLGSQISPGVFLFVVIFYSDFLIFKLDINAIECFSFN